MVMKTKTKVILGAVGFAIGWFGVEIVKKNSFVFIQGEEADLNEQ